ncbi:MAG: ammonium transporter, partial [Candidatus Acidiferrum sp.]
VSVLFSVARPSREQPKRSGADISMKHLGWKCCLLVSMALAALPLLARQTPASAPTASTAAASTAAASNATPPATQEIPKAVSEKLAQLEQHAAEAESHADNAWMLVSAALVLLMTGPGLALFYGGLVRRKNTLAIMMQSFLLMALISVMWALVGYSLCFGGNGPVIGGFEHAFLRGVGADPNPDYAGTIPQSTFMIYQLMFAIITPALITGATAERMKFSGTVLFLALWFLVVYAPLAHMVWGKGGFLNASLGGKFPTLDFAGGTVVHISSGVSALVCALYLGKRTGYPKQPMPPHSLVLSFIGACLLWVGWFGFNAGSALSAGSLATSAFVATHFATAAAAISWSLAEWIKNGRASALGAISGAVAGLVAITPAAGCVGPMPALAIGFIAGLVCYWMVTKVKSIFGYDDALDAFGVHGVGGTIGALLTGVFAQQVINPIFGAGKPVGGLDGHWGQLGNQLVGILIAWGFALVGSIVLLKITDMITGVRVSETDEIEGLDITQHGEEAYNLES